MLSDEAVLRRLEPGTSILVGTVDPSGWPSCCRGVALVVHPDREGVTVYVPVATAAETVANIASNGRVAVAATEIVSHVSVQLKGRSIAVRIAGEEEAETVHAHFERLMAALDSVGLPRGISRTMSRWPAFAVGGGGRLRADARAPGGHPREGPMSVPLTLSALHPRCFQGVVPSLLATADADRVPNVIYISQVHHVDERHVALSRQFFNKTTRNLEVNPRAAVEIYDPVTFEAFRLRLLRSETTGALFDTMALRIQAIASHTGMSGIFKLRAADVFEAERVEKVEGFLSGPVCPRPDDALTLEGRRSELRGLQWLSERINRAGELGTLLDAVLEALDTYFGFRHTMLLLADEATGRLVTLGSRGYGEAGIGAEVAVGEGLVGTVARERRVLRISGLDQELAYGRAIRRQVISDPAASPLAAEIPLPGLKDARSALVIPLAVCDHLVGVLAAESRDPVAFDEWHEAYLEQKCPDVRIESAGRGRFTLVARGPVELEERDSA